MRAAALFVGMIAFVNATSLFASEFKGLSIGMAESDLPASLTGLLSTGKSGWIENDWVSVALTKGRVESNRIVYEGATRNSERVSKRLPLARALRLHSLASDRQQPRLASYEMRDGRLVGVFDTANGIVYQTASGQPPDEPSSVVAIVAYHFPRSLIFENANPLPSSKSDDLLRRAAELNLTAKPPLNPAKPPVQITGDALQILAREAVQEVKGSSDPESAVGVALGSRAIAKWGPIQESPFRLHTSDDIMIVVSTPYSSFLAELSERVRLMESTDRIPFDPNFSIVVEPLKIDAPDIVKVVVERDGVIVQPLSVDLPTKTFNSRNGARVILHAGSVTYPPPAFAPGTTVRITAIPSEGSNIRETLTSETLERFK